MLRDTDDTPPASNKAALTRRSRARFLSILAVQYAVLLLGLLKCSGHPCHKHPSTKTATRSRGNTMSAPGLADHIRNGKVLTDPKATSMKQSPHGYLGSCIGPPVGAHRRSGRWAARGRRGWEARRHRGLRSGRLRGRFHAVEQLQNLVVVRLRRNLRDEVGDGALGPRRR